MYKIRQYGIDEIMTERLNFCEIGHNSTSFYQLEFNLFSKVDNNECVLTHLIFTARQVLLCGPFT